ncbi:hypothetical protein RM553_19145, partial [Zunongwangia sp. F363]
GINYLDKTLSKKETNKLYDEIIESLIQETSLELSLHNIKIDNAFEELKENLSESRKNRSNQSRKNSQLFNNNYHFEKEFFELLILQYESLWIILTRTIYLEEYDLKIKGLKKRKLVMFLFILNNQINNLNSVLKLSKSGYFQNSDRIFRNFIELSEKSLAILFDDKYFSLFQEETSSKKEEFDKWHKQKPSKTFEIVKKALSTLENDEFYSLFYEVRDKLYNKHSKVVHGDFESILRGSIYYDKNSELLRMYLYGNVDDNLKHNLNGYLIYLKIMIQAQTVILVKDFNLHFGQFREDGDYYIFLNSLTDKIFKVYLKLFQTQNN